MVVYAGPFPETSQSNTHVLLVTDYFTKWVEAAPLQKKDPFSVAKALATVFYRWAPLLLVVLHLCSAMGSAGVGCKNTQCPQDVSLGEKELSLLQERPCSASQLLFTKSLGRACYPLVMGRRKRQKWFSARGQGSCVPVLCRSFKAIPGFLLESVHFASTRRPSPCDIVLVENTWGQ